jgi:hypothetical protein
MHVLGAPYSTVKNKSTWLPRASWLKRGLTNYKEVLARASMRALTEDGGIYIPEINDPHETPFYDRPDIIVGEITAIEPATYQTILDHA